MRSPVGELVSAGRKAVERWSAPRNDTPVSYVSRGQAGFPASPVLGVTGDATAAIEAPGRNGTLFAIINRLATSVAALDWHMHRKTGNPDDVCEICGSEDDAPRGVELIESHPALSVWNRPNDFFTQSLYVETFQQHVDLVGEAYWLVAYVGNRPIELWPVRPDRMAPVRDREKFIRGWMYRSPDGTLVPLDLKEVVSLRQPAPWDPYRGAGAAQTLYAQLYGSAAAAEWNRNFFANSAIPAGVIELPGNLTDAQWDEFQQRWAESHKGIGNAHRVAMLEYGAVYKDVNYSMKDMQFIELRQATREEIREAFGIHGHVLGLTEDVNRANATAAKADYAEWMTVPRGERVKDALNGPYLRLFGDAMGPKNYEFAYANPVPSDRDADNAERQSKVDAFIKLIGAGVDADEAADYCGLPRMKVTKPKPIAPPQPPPGQGGDGAPPGEEQQAA